MDIRIEPNFNYFANFFSELRLFEHYFSINFLFEITS